MPTGTPCARRGPSTPRPIPTTAAAACSARSRSMRSTRCGPTATRFVWNTPNATSLSGYLTMGWQEVGRIPVVVAPASARFPFVVLTARRAAGRDAVATSFGRAAWEVFGDDPDVDARARLRAGRAAGLATHKTQAFLAWRYNNPALGYRVLLHGSTPSAGFVVFRLRRRGRAVEAVLCDLFAPAG